MVDFCYCYGMPLLCEFAEILFSAVFEMKFDSPSYFTGGVPARVIHQSVVGKLTFFVRRVIQAQNKGPASYIYIE